MPVRDILLDADGNRLLSGGDYATASDAQAVKQGIECALRLYEAEYWLDESLGVPYQRRILIRNFVELEVRGYLAAAILGVVDVTRVVSTGFSFDSTNRAASASFSAASPYGLVEGAVTP